MILPRSRAFSRAVLIALAVAFTLPGASHAQTLALAHDSAAMRLFALPRLTSGPGEPRVPRFDIYRLNHYASWGAAIGAGVGFVGGEIAERNVHGINRAGNVAFATLGGFCVGMIVGAATYVVRELY